ncbi:EMB protein, partial [Penelope pileata]|nr:EMB protein [Penelope pileata]
SEPLTTTQIVNHQTSGNVSDHMTLGHDVSTPGPNLTTSEFKEATKLNTSKSLNMEYEILLPGDSGTSVEKSISLGSAAKIELSCRLSDKYSRMKVHQVTWKKGNEIIEHKNKTENSWSIQVDISENKKLGTYTCTVKGEKEFNAMFHLQVPRIEGREKPVIGYRGDASVLICTSYSYTPIAWTWYKNNGSEQIAINDSLLLDKYVIDRPDPGVTYLKIMKLTKEDEGVYWCEAAFELGKSKRKLKLNILTLVAPLKPFLAIVAEVLILIAAVFTYEIWSKKKEKHTEEEREFDQIEKLRSEENNGVENTSARHRK